VSTIILRTEREDGNTIRKKRRLVKANNLRGICIDNLKDETLAAKGL